MTKKDAIELLKDVWNQASDIVTLDDTQGMIRWLEMRSRQEGKTFEDLARWAANIAGCVADVCDLLCDHRDTELENKLAEKHGVSAQAVAQLPAEHSKRMRLREECLKLYADLISRYPEREIKAETINWLLWRRYPDLCQRLDVSIMSLDQAEPILRDLLTATAKPDATNSPKRQTIGHLGLIVDETTGTVRRDGNVHTVRFTLRSSELHTLLVAWKAGTDGASRAQWKNGYPGDTDSEPMRGMKRNVNEKIKVLGVRLAPRDPLKLEELPNVT